MITRCFRESAIMPSHKAILTGYSWNCEPTLVPQRTPIFLTYSFATRWSDERFSAADQKLARYALKQWGDACGIRFLETRSTSAEITFSWETLFWDSTTVAYAEFPELYTPENCAPGEVLERRAFAGDVVFNTGYKSDLENKSYMTYVLLHEIGHALGLKHPFHTSPYNRKKLGAADDHSKNTVMSYDNGGSTVYPTKLGPLDKQAIRELYGSDKSDGKHVSAWSWNKHTETLTQIAKEGADRIHGTGVQDVIHGLGGNDRLFGFDGDDTLVGGAGHDTLSGSDGDDVFVFDTPLDPLSNVDKIVGFDIFDSIHLAASIFTKLPLGTLNSRNFQEADEADDSDDYIVFDDEPGLLYYDVDGSGPVAKVLFAKITGSWSSDIIDLSAYNFQVV
jgi:hypothetical protein